VGGPSRDGGGYNARGRHRLANPTLDRAVDERETRRSRQAHPLSEEGWRILEERFPMARREFPMFEFFEAFHRHVLLYRRPGLARVCPWLEVSLGWLTWFCRYSYLVLVVRTIGASP